MSTLDATQALTLNALAQLVISPSADGKRPGGGEIGFVDYVVQAGSVEWLLAGLAIMYGTALLVCGQLAFLLGALLRPIANER